MADSEARLFDADGNNIGTYRLEVMDTFWKRFMGLMGRDDVPIGIAALFRKCSSIHMFFMKVPLDVIYYGAAMSDGRVRFGPKDNCQGFTSLATDRTGTRPSDIAAP